VSRDRNVLIGGSVYALTAVLAVNRGSERELRRRIRDWRKARSPFAQVPGTHFARLVVIDRLVFEGPEQHRPGVHGQYLLFTATFDGADGQARDEYLDEMCRRVPQEVESVFCLCAGAPCPLADNPAGFRRWIARHQIPVAAFYGHDPKATVSEIRRAGALRAAVSRFARLNAYERPEVLKERFEQVFGP
jgi:hypothetical protein